MANLTLANREEREDMVNYWQPATGALHNILRFSIAADGGEQEDDDDYWHP
jgi:hypothetical protein